MSREGHVVAVIRRFAMGRRQALRVALCGAVIVFAVGCASPTIVEDHLASDGSVTTEFTVDDREIVLTARFDTKLAADETLMVEWIFPDGSVYLRKPVGRSAGSVYRIETDISVRGKTPARHPGIWRVNLARDGEPLVSREFEIREQSRADGSGAAEFAALAYCGPSRWNDPAISAKRSNGGVSGRPGAWIGGDVLEAAGAVYSSVVLLTGCAPG